jgi:acyl-CoA synthetase (AMP-forming)/AMP-acid ligase II
LVQEARDFKRAVAGDVALLLHTSGTTSRPKQVPLLHRNLMASARAIVDCYRLTPADISYCAMPMFHVHGLVASVLSALLSGGAVVVPHRLSHRQFAKHLARHGVTWFSAGPTTHRMLMGRMDGAAARLRESRLRFIRSCSSALSPSLMAQAEAHFGVPMLEAYGMTEASHQIASNPLPPGKRLPGSVGLATGTELTVVDEIGTLLPRGSQGEVVVRGPGVTPGYLNNPEANAASFVKGGLRTGDLGAIDGDGYLRLVGRIKEMIIRGGENISPYEIEAVLLAHPAVTDVVCFGISDDKYGEVVGVAVVLREPASESELAKHCRSSLAAFKVPRVIRIVKEIPRTATGKLQRRRIATLLGET